MMNLETTIRIDISPDILVDKMLDYVSKTKENYALLYVRLTHKGTFVPEIRHRNTIYRNTKFICFIVVEEVKNMTRQEIIEKFKLDDIRFHIIKHPLWLFAEEYRNYIKEELLDE